jgi:hypothetical protein
VIQEEEEVGSEETESAAHIWDARMMIWQPRAHLQYIVRKPKYQESIINSGIESVLFWNLASLYVYYFAYDSVYD